MTTDSTTDVPGVVSIALFSLDSVICGDNCEVMRQWPNECIDLVVTSPPYDDLREYGKHEWDFYGVAWNLVRLLKPGGVIVWVVNDATKNGSETGTSMRQAIHMQTLGLNIHDTMAYQKSGVPFPETTRYAPVLEWMFVMSKGKPKTINLIRDKRNTYAGDKVARANGQRQKSGEVTENSAWRNDRSKVMQEMGVRENVWRYATGRGNSTKDACAYAHPAIFPEALASDHIQSWSNPGDVVLDPFAGSGTTLKAAKELNRRYVGIEVNPEYVKICEERTMQESLPLYCENSRDMERKASPSSPSSTP